MDVADPSFYAALPPESNSLLTLPPAVRSGLTAVAVFASISLVSTTALFIHLTYKLVSWHLQRPKKSAQDLQDMPMSPGMDLTLGLAERHFGFGRPATAPRAEPTPKREPNQFVVLIYNLLLADMHQSIAFFLNVVWVGKDAIHVRSRTCWMQGYFVSTGDLSASLFIGAIALHTYGTIVRGYKPPQWVIVGTCVGIWLFNYLMVAIGILGTNNGQATGGFYVRAAAWCWINESYENLRLLTHYLFIFISLGLTSVVYLLIFLTLRRRDKAAPATPPPAKSLSSPRSPRQSASKSSLDIRTTLEAVTTGAHSAPGADEGGYHPAFLVYPIIYVVCTLPLAAGRVATMAGASVPLTYFCAAGALITSNGWLDVLLWGSTRRSLIFGAVDEQQLGLGTFAFMRTPHNRRYGNMVWVEGAGKSMEDEEAAAGGWWGRLVGRRRRSHSDGTMRRGARSGSQESLHGGSRGDMGMAIQLDTVTTVVVEVQERPVAERERVASPQPSAYSMASRDDEKYTLPNI